MNRNGFALWMIEAGLMLISVPMAFLCAHRSRGWLSSGVRGFLAFAERRRIAVATIAAAMLILRIVLLPWIPAPLPYTANDFSFLLAADTFAHGRLANPTPALWQPFESIHITVMPTYASMYFPGPGLLMAPGKIAFGHPWAGILLTAALACAAICWMLQAWLPPGWAFLGGLIAVLRIGLFSYWTNSYTGGATLSVLGGALVLGSLPRLTQTARFRYGMTMAIGIALLVLTRPYEGVLVCLPVCAMLARWLVAVKQRPPARVLVRRAIAPLMLVLAVLIWLGYYDMRAFGKATTLPYTIARSQYAVVPYYVWQSARPAPHYDHSEMQRFYTETESAGFFKLHSRGGFVAYYAGKLITTILFFGGIALLLPLVFARRVLLDRRTRFFSFCLPLWMAGVGIGVFLVPHYLAPFTAGVYALGLQATRHLWVWKHKAQPVGQILVLSMLSVCVLMAGLRTIADPLCLGSQRWHISSWSCTWYGPGHFGTERAAVAETLEKRPGKHLALVRYRSVHEPSDEWVYNGADLDGSKTIWAHEMDAATNAELMRHYKDRDVWLVQPDVESQRIAPYSGR